MEDFTSQIREMYARANDKERTKIQNELRDLQWSLDTEWELATRLLAGPLEMTLLRLGYDLNLFRLLAASKHPLGSKDFAGTTGASTTLLAHLLRALAAFGLIKDGPDQYSANRPTRVFDNVHVQGALVHSFHMHLETFHAAPNYLKETGYEIPGSSLFQKALKTDLQPFDWMKERPEQMESLAHAMAFEDQRIWVDSYPVMEQSGTFASDPESVLFVDVGGSLGHQAVALRKKFPDLPGRIIVQDIPATLEHAPPIEGIEFAEQDFFLPQPIKNAKFYYLRHILHDWNDEDCIKILKNLVPALGPDSRIVIDDIVVPDSGVPWPTAFLDLAMMFTLGAQERTQAEWEYLVDQAGLKVINVHNYDSRFSSVTIVVPK